MLILISYGKNRKRKLTIPVTAFQFREQKHFKSLLHEIMDKLAFFKFMPEQEKQNQGIAHILLEMFQIRRKFV